MRSDTHLFSDPSDGILESTLKILKGCGEGIGSEKRLRGERNRASRMGDEGYLTIRVFSGESMGLQGAVIRVDLKAYHRKSVYNWLNIKLAQKVRSIIEKEFGCWLGEATRNLIKNDVGYSACFISPEDAREKNITRDSEPTFPSLENS